MKIRKLHLKNYKVFDDLELDFTDADGNTLNQVVLAGLNGTGKTTVLELFRDFLRGWYLRTELDSYSQVEVVYDLNNCTDSLYNSFYKKYDENKKNDLQYGLDKRYSSDVEYSLNKKYVPVTTKNRIITAGEEQHILDIHTRNSIYFNHSDIIYRHSHDKIRKKVSDDYPNKVREISFSTHKSEMKDFILKPIKNKVFENKDLPPKKVIQQEIDDINQVFEGIKRNSHFIDIDDDNLIFQSANGKRINFEQLSSGEKYVYFMGFMLKRMNINNSMIMIDEPEDSLHPSWQSQMLQFYSNIGENNQVILATHSPHIIGSAKAESVFLLKAENDTITVSHPKYSEGHSIPYVLSEVMETDYRNTYTNNIINDYLELIRVGEHETEKGQQLAAEIEKLDANSEERRRVDLSLRRFKAIGK